jgi:hypothetical protein
MYLEGQRIDRQVALDDDDDDDDDEVSEVSNRGDLSQRSI